MKRLDKGYRGDASQFFVAGELCRRGLVAVVTLGNCPNTDILCSDAEARRFLHIQVKTFRPGDKTCSVGKKAENDYGERFIWILAGIPPHNDPRPFVYYMIPSAEMSIRTKACFETWKRTPGAKGQERNQDNTFRTITLPPGVDNNGWSISEYENRWDIIEEKIQC